MKIVLYQPQIPQNTGNIIRTCRQTGSELIIVRPMGFSLSDRKMRRAGLSYWKEVNITVIDDIFSFLNESQDNFYFFSSKAKEYYTQVEYKFSDLLIFGSETDGLPKQLIELYPERFVTIPQVCDRCYNLSTSVAIGLFEAWRQLSFVQ